MATEAGQTPSEEKVGLWEDFVDVFHAPSDVFARRRSAGFWMPLLIVAVVATVLNFASSRILQAPLDADTRRQTQEMARDNPDLDISGARGMMESIETVVVWFTGLAVAATVFAWGLLLWVGGKIAGSAIGARAGILIATYATIPRLLENVVAILEGIVRGPDSLDSVSRLAWSPARFLDPDTASEMAMFVATAVDLFAIWYLVVLAIGLAVIGNMTRARAGAVVAGLWAVLALPGFIGALAG